MQTNHQPQLAFRTIGLPLPQRVHDDLRQRNITGASFGLWGPNPAPSIGALADVDAIRQRSMSGDAFAKLEAGDPGAIAGFAAHIGKQPNDQLATFHLKRLLNGATGTRIAMD